MFPFVEETRESVPTKASVQAPRPGHRIGPASVTALGRGACFVLLSGFVGFRVLYAFTQQ